jgi:uroporphyrin-III C-methyltransferase
VGTLGDLPGLIEREGLGSPAIIVVGDVLKGMASVSLVSGATRAA